jgi:endo-1,3-1,4-beta-glycanase ExoK
MLKIFCAAFLIFCAVPVTVFAEDIPFFASVGKIDRSVWNLSHGWSNGEHQSCEWRAANITQGMDGQMAMHLRETGREGRKVGCGEIQAKDVTHYGRYEARMKTAKGAGLNTAFFTYVGPPHGVAEHDEIDFEFLGKEPRRVEVNYHRAGQNMGPFKIDLGFDASEGFHDYVFEWYPDRIVWFVDGEQVFETPEGADIPSNAGRIMFSLWSGGQPANEWLGRFKYKRPVSAEVEWVRFTPFEAEELEGGADE